MIYLIPKLSFGLTGASMTKMWCYFNDMMDEPIDIQTVSNGKPYGDDIVLQKGDNELLIPYGDERKIGM